MRFQDMKSVTILVHDVPNLPAPSIELIFYSSTVRRGLSDHDFNSQPWSSPVLVKNLNHEVSTQSLTVRRVYGEYQFNLPGFDFTVKESIMRRIVNELTGG